MTPERVIINDIGSTPFSPAIRHDSEIYWASLEELRALKFVLTLCIGNAFRSRLGKKVLNGLGVPAISAAVGDITMQRNRVLPPDSVMQFMNDRHPSSGGVLPIFQAEPMRIVTELMVASAAHVLAYCDPEHLNHVIDLSDPRLHLLYANDPTTPDDYHATYEQVVSGTVKFFHKNFRDRSAAITAPAYASRRISMKIEEETRKLNYSIIPGGWGNPLTSYDSCGIELF